MPSSGKSTIGKILATKLEKDFYDSDDLITKRIDMPIRDFFRKYGEAEFRKIEKDVIAELSKGCGAVIATGGGVILDKDNITALKGNGVLVFLDRPLEHLLPTSDRPLSSDFSALEALFSYRYPLYKSAADIQIKSGSTPDASVTEIMKELF